MTARGAELGLRFSGNPPECEPPLSTGFCLTWLVAAIIASQFTLGFAVYLAAIAWSAVRAVRRPTDGLWLLLFGLAVAVVSIPPDYPDELGGDVPRAYFWWGLSIACVAGCMFLGSLLKPRRFTDESAVGRRPLMPLLIFLGVVLLSAVYGYVQGNGLGTIVRQGTGLSFLFLFIYLGYRVRPSNRELSRSLQNIVSILVAYASLYLTRVAYLNLAQRTSLPEGDFYRDRNPVLFFCGLFATVELGRWLFGKAASQRPRNWLSACLLPILLLTSAAVLSGSRAIVASMLAGAFFLLVLRFSSHPVRACCVAVLVFVSGSYGVQAFVSQIEKKDSFAQHIAARYLVSLDEDSSFLERSSQLSAISDGLRAKPVFGYGLGASLVWFDPSSFSYVETAFVDSGIGYLLFKMGLLGAGAFFFLVVSWFRRSWRCWAATKETVFVFILGMLAYYLTFLSFGPSFFQFLFSFWAGILIGYLYLVSGRIPVVRPKSASVQA